VPDTDRVIILSKAHASMKSDEKTRCKDKEQATKKREYLVMMELYSDKTSEYDAGQNKFCYSSRLTLYICSLSTDEDESRNWHNVRFG